MSRWVSTRFTLGVGDGGQKEGRKEGEGRRGNGTWLFCLVRELDSTESTKLKCDRKLSV